tara:strand:- start:979 stop:1173 length:195 start_codon:yes stop_codon:yes gene_type:complete
MDIYRETEIRIEFAKGEEYTPTIVKDGEEVISDYATTFSNKTHQIEELLNYITECENDGCNVYL